MKKLPNGISNFEELVRDNCIYVDKTIYIEKLEKLSDKRLMFLRPRKFGKTLFTSMLEYYYDIKRKDGFDELFKNTYIGKNPTENKNKYYVLRFNFSGIDTSSMETTINGFKREVASSVKVFIEKYQLDFIVNTQDDAEGIVDNLFKAFDIQKKDEKIYVIIDEYDHFANELLGFKTDDFKKLVAGNGKIRKWYEILKKGTESVVERIFITGVAPITLDSTTSGFNIARDLTKDINFNNMLGFCKKDVKYIMSELEISEEKQEELLPVIKENYDGYVFSNMIEENIEKYKMYNSNMTLYFLNKFVEQNKIPEELIDINIISDYRKIEGLLNLEENERKVELLEKIVAGVPIESELTEKFNIEMDFGEKELISLLFYLGYLTIFEKGFSKLKFKILNEVIKNIYTDYFLEYISRISKIEVDRIDTESINEEMLIHGRVDKIMELLKEYLTNLSNRDYTKFDEKYVKLLFYAISKNLRTYLVKNELEVGGKYVDILLIPMKKISERYGILIEFKYIKQEDYEKDNSLLEKKKEEARKQLQEYKNTWEIKTLPNLKSYSVIIIKDKLVVEEV